VKDGKVEGDTMVAQVEHFSFLVVMSILFPCDDNSDCGDDAFCKKETGDCDGAGVCRLRYCFPVPPDSSFCDVCLLSLSGACGCDGLEYPDECLASMGGVNVDFHVWSLGTNYPEKKCPPVLCTDDTDCEPGEFCLKDTGLCDEGTGLCAIPPDSVGTCPAYPDPVCDCWGHTLDNVCEANRIRRNILHEGECTPPADCMVNTDCEFYEYCEKTSDGWYTDCDGPGVCALNTTPPGLSCVDFPDFLACGCDGIVYDSRCLMAGEGVSAEYAMTDGGYQPSSCPAVPCSVDSDCEEGDFCAKEIGECEGTGFCSTPPDGPCGDGIVLCGCDGLEYGSFCSSAQAGVNVVSSGECGCLPDCEGKECGDDGCGGTCGECAGSLDVCIDGVCTCEPDCEGKECGPDGCGGDCGECDDGDVCTGIETCLLDTAVCVPGEPLFCDDGDVCTDDICDPVAGCEYPFNTEPCDDNQICTVGDACEDGACVSGSDTLDCDDENPCTDDSCDPQMGCVNSENVSPCDDGNECTTGDACAGGQCVPGGGTPDCDDDNLCTDDSCDPAIGCVNAPNSESCDDGDACSQVDVCLLGGCSGSDWVVCDGTEACHLTGSCNTDTGLCEYPLAQENTPCPDGDLCNGDELCDAEGNCQPGVPLNCDDGNVCTDDGCDPSNGCENTNNSLPCDDNHACTENEYCGNGICNYGQSVDCDDNNACTEDSCEPAAGCVNTETVIYDDQIACTSNSCDPQGGCVFTNVDAACTPPNLCKDNFCNPFHAGADADGCVFPDKDCNDGNECTDDTCDQATGCVFTNNQAMCVVGICSSSGADFYYQPPVYCSLGECTVPWPPPPNEHCAANECTTVTCDPVTGCGYVPDHSACNDGYLCTDNSCDPATGCVTVNNSVPCDDGDGCTVGDQCSGGLCVGGSPMDCDDGNDCTVDQCVSGSCDHSGNACTGATPYCSGTTCVECLSAGHCDDQDVCTTDECTDDVCVNQPPGQCPYDCGDAPDPNYPTLLASTGACHIPGQIYLGSLIDAELDGIPTPDAFGDDNDNLADEDGVFMMSAVNPGMTAYVDVVASGTGILNAWVDFNQDGDWEDNGEQIFIDKALVAGNNSLSFDVPAGASLGLTFSRYRFDSLGGLPFHGWAIEGEVEDHTVYLEVPMEYDYGDAPDPSYPTLLASQGARHVLDGMTFLGATVDAEPDGFQSPQADGDDLDTSDDEDGVVFTSPIFLGGQATLDVLASREGFLDAWVDFNQNGTWMDQEEQIFTSQPLVPGPNNLGFMVPPTAVPGPTFARFRFSTYPVGTFDGDAMDGEVEDYLIIVE